MQKTTPAKLAVALAVALTLPFGAKAQEPSAETVVATVNGTDITLGHMVALHGKLPQQYRDLPDDVLFSGILDQLVQQAVLADSSDGLSTENGLVIENETRSLLAAQVYGKVAEEALTDEAIQAAYDEIFADAPEEEEFDASHILVETQEFALELKAQLDGGADFATLAQEHSTGPSGPGGGALGWFGKGMMVGEFEDAVVALEVGEVSEPVETQFGWHVIRLNDKRIKPAPPLDQVRPQIVQQIQRDAVEQLIEDLTAKAEISRIEDGEIDPALMRDSSLIAE